MILKCITLNRRLLILNKRERHLSILLSLEGLILKLDRI